jgi:putative ubiquitin-RnfH superfamily antitoxin RatB of RatAB toxin-antitoxin module
MASDALLRVTVVYSPAARQLHEVQLVLPAGSTVLQALAGTGIAQLFPSLDLSASVLGIWGRKSAPDQVLRDMDRVEIYRPLTVDPKAARRERFIKQGARTAGLFEKKRLGAKAGY